MNRHDGPEDGALAAIDELNGDYARHSRSARALDVSFSFFQDSLAPYGEWVSIENYGWAWRPSIA